MMFIRQFLTLILVSTVLGCTKNQQAEFQSGDLIFHTSTSSQSKALQLATNSIYSHVGIIYKNKGKYYVYEAIQPVQLTEFDKWTQRGKNGHYIVKRLKNAAKLLSPEVLARMKEVGQKYKGKDYDLYFEWSDDKMYCSELVWKVYKQALDIEIGQLQPIKDFDLTHPIVKDKIRERYGDNLSENEPVISPAQMYESDLLITVFSN